MMDSAERLLVGSQIVGISWRRVASSKVHLGPQFEKPFEMEVPSAKVTSAREVDAVKVVDPIATSPAERTLMRVHPVVFRARPLGTLIVLTVTAASAYGLWRALAMDGSAKEAELLGSTTLASIDWLLWTSARATLSICPSSTTWFC